MLSLVFRNMNKHRCGKRWLINETGNIIHVRGNLILSLHSVIGSTSIGASIGGACIG